MLNKNKTETDLAWEEICNASNNAQSAPILNDKPVEAVVSAQLSGHRAIIRKPYDRAKRAAAKAAREAKHFAQVRAMSTEQYPSEAAFLEQYTGNSPFFLSLKNQFDQRGSLTEKQWGCITNAMLTTKQEEKPKPRVFSLEVGTTLIVTKFYAKIIGREFGLTRPHFGIEVVEVLDETNKAYLIKAKVSAQRTAHCCVCGLELTNAKSVVAGIGPICAEKYGVDSVEALSKKLQQIVTTVSLWIPKSQIKEMKSIDKEVVPAV